MGIDIKHRCENENTRPLKTVFFIDKKLTRDRTFFQKTQVEMGLMAD